MKVGFFGGKFLPLHKGHLFMIDQAYLSVDKLYVVLSSSEKYDRMVCARDGIKYMPAAERLSWLGAHLSHTYGTEIGIVHIIDRPEDAEHDWEYGSDQVKTQIPEQITHIFSSEPDYTTHFNKYYPGAKHIVVDPKRSNYNVSATKIRKDPWMYWHYLTEETRGFLCKKVAIVGTESCGKSVLVDKLCTKYATTGVLEVGREYCENYNNQLTVPMFDQIAMHHWITQKQFATDANQIMFVDSDAVITQYYLNMYFGKKSALIEEIIKIQDYDLVLYLEPDVPWTDDGVRFAGEEAVRLRNNWELKNMYTDRNIDFYSISGTWDERSEAAFGYIERLLQGKEMRRD